MLAPTGTLLMKHDGSLNQTIPALGLPREVAIELREWLSQGEVTLKISMDNSIKQGFDFNVMGDLQGQATKKRLIILCAHYDGHDIAQGALDNASGTAVVMEVARGLKPLADKLGMNIRFVLFGSEETGEEIPELSF